MTGKDAGRGIAGLKHDTIFVNANDPNDLYYVNEHDGKYFLKHGSGDGKIRVDGSTLIFISCSGWYAFNIYRSC